MKDFIASVIASPCCDMMKAHLHDVCCSQHDDRWECPDYTLAAFADGRIGIPVRDGGRSMIVISFCPWCGVKLPVADSGRQIDVSDDE